MMNRLIATLFLSREVAHREHLRVTGVGSYAAHKALNEFYDEIVDNADSIAEAYQGRHGIMEPIPYLNPGVMKGSAADILQSHLDAVEKMRYQAADKDETAIQNLIDEAVATYLSVLYKLRNLK